MARGAGTDGGTRHSAVQPAARRRADEKCLAVAELLFTPSPSISPYSALLLGGVTHPCFGNFVAFSMSADERKFNQFRAFAEEKLQPDLEHQLAKRDRIYQNLAE